MRHAYFNFFLIVLFLTMTASGNLQKPIRLLMHAIPENQHKPIDEIVFDLESKLKTIDKEIMAKVCFFSYHAKNTTVNSSFEEPSYDLMKLSHAKYIDQSHELLESQELFSLQNEKLTLEIAEKIYYSSYWQQNLLMSPVLINKMVVDEKPLLFSLVQSKIVLRFFVGQCRNHNGHDGHGDLLDMITEMCNYIVPAFCPGSLEIFERNIYKREMLRKITEQVEKELGNSPALAQTIIV